MTTHRPSLPELVIRRRNSAVRLTYGHTERTVLAENPTNIIRVR